MNETGEASNRRTQDASTQSLTAREPESDFAAQDADAMSGGGAAARAGLASMRMGTDGSSRVLSFDRTMAGASRASVPGSLRGPDNAILRSQLNEALEEIARLKEVLGDHRELPVTYRDALRRVEVQAVEKKIELEEMQARFSVKLRRIAELDERLEALTQENRLANQTLARSEAEFAAASATNEALESRLVLAEQALEEVSLLRKQLAATENQLAASQKRLLGASVIANVADVKQRALAREAELLRHERDAERERADDSARQAAELGSRLKALQRELNGRKAAAHRGGAIARLERMAVATRQAPGRLLAWFSGRHTAPPLFDKAFYLRTYPDVASGAIDPWAHYNRFGVAELRNPNALFDTKWYLERYPDVKAAGINPLIHYLKSGVLEMRDPHPLFSTSWYLSTHPELIGTRTNPLEHYLRSNGQVGETEGSSG